VSLSLVVPPGLDADKLLKEAKAQKVKALRAAGETREVYFESLVICTGVPRPSTPYTWSPEPNEADPTHPANVARLNKATKAEPAPVVELRQPAQPLDWKRITIQISPPDERSTGVVAEGRFCIQDGEVCVEDLWGKLLGSAPFGPGDDPAIIARKLLRQKTGEKWGAFYAPIQTPPRSIH
jgi:hypothetical protein